MVVKLKVGDRMRFIPLSITFVNDTIWSCKFDMYKIQPEKH